MGGLYDLRMINVWKTLIIQEQTILLFQSERVVALSNNVVSCLNIGHQNMSVFNINSEFSLQSFIDMHTGFNIDVTSFVSPVSIEGDGYSLNQLWGTFQRSGSISLSLLWTHFMMRLAVRPGWVGGEVRGGGFLSVWVVGCRWSGGCWWGHGWEWTIGSAWWFSDWLIIVVIRVNVTKIKESTYVKILWVQAICCQHLDLPAYSNTVKTMPDPD